MLTVQLSRKGKKKMIETKTGYDIWWNEQKHDNLIYC